MEISHISSLLGLVAHEEVHLLFYDLLHEKRSFSSLILHYKPCPKWTQPYCNQNKPQTLHKIVSTNQLCGRTCYEYDSISLGNGVPEKWSHKVGEEGSLYVYCPKWGKNPLIRGKFLSLAPRKVSRDSCATQPMN